MKILKAAFAENQFFFFKKKGNLFFFFRKVKKIKKFYYNCMSFILQGYLSQREGFILCHKWANNKTG